MAAAGGHNMLMSGSPGSGKTLIARSMPGILPGLTVEEALDVTRVYSVADQLSPDQPLVRHRPFRAPHHTVSYAGLIGGGRWPKPGEISLAHRGVLFLDELPEFGARMLEMLHQPLEDKSVAISRSAGSLTYPANFILVASMNPCPCGFYSDPEKECTCSISMVKAYQKKISGPLMDRIDTLRASKCPAFLLRNSAALALANRAPGCETESSMLERFSETGSRRPGCKPTRIWALPKSASLCPLGILPVRPDRDKPAQGGDAADAVERTGLSPHAKREASPDDCRLGRSGTDTDGACGRGDPVSASVAGVT